MTEAKLAPWRSRRNWMALLIVIAATVASYPVEIWAYGLVAPLLGLHKSPAQTLVPANFGAFMMIRMAWDAGLWIAVCAVLGVSAWGFPMRDGRLLRHILIGLGTGVAVMLGVMLGIWWMGAATVSLTGQSVASGVRNGSAWLLLDLLGALGEEVYGRAIVLVVAERFLGWRWAVLISGVMFSGLHLANPGASRVWLLRLFLQGALLAFAVFRTRTLWWAVGYHTGWNWVSAPLFGAVGSGYMDQGHVLNFAATGPVWMTGGAVGPEGSVLAFVAVCSAFGLLLVTTKDRPGDRA